MMKVSSYIVLTLSLLLSQGLVHSATAQVGAAPAAAPAIPALEPTVSNLAIATATKNGVPITTVSDLSSSISVEAVVIPYNVAKRVFGKEIATRYSVVSLIVSNRDAKQGAVIHSIFLDYSKWLFSGMFAGQKDDAKADIAVWQTQTNPSQVASAEVRTVRTDFQDAQLWSGRNFVLHIASAVGTAGAAASFSTANDLFAPSVAAWNGSVVPALGVIWPDNSQTQLNLLNDIGFRTNKVIAAKSSDIVVAFFPQERFLTPKLQKIYREAPAAFFNPGELLFESGSGKSDRNKLGFKTSSPVEKLMKEIGELGIITPGKCSDGTQTTQCSMTAAVVHYEHAYGKLTALSALPASNSNDKNSVDPCAYLHVDGIARTSINAAYESAIKDTNLTPNDCLTVGLLNRISLNRIRVVVGGIMTIDVGAIPATISSAQIVNEKQVATWTKGQTITGTIAGTFLSGAAVTVAITPPAGTAGVAATPSLTSFQVNTSNATDASLPFTAIISDADIVPGTKLVFTATKTAQDKSVTASAPFTYTVNTDLNLTADAAQADGTIPGSIKGTGLNGATVTAKGHNGSPTEAQLPVKVKTSADNSLTFVIAPTVAITKGTVIDITVLRSDGSNVVLTYTAP